MDLYHAQKGNIHFSQYRKRDLSPILVKASNMVKKDSKIMIIRKVEERDVEDILSLIQAKADFDGCLDSLNSKKGEIYNAFLSADPKAKAIIAEIDGKVIGLATVSAQ